MTAARQREPAVRQREPAALRVQGLTKRYAVPRQEDVLAVNGIVFISDIGSSGYIVIVYTPACCA